jgi:hypothetical protein
MTMTPIDAFLLLEGALTEPQKKRLANEINVLRHCVDPTLRRKRGDYWKDPEAKSDALMRRKERRLQTGNFITVEWRSKDHKIERQDQVMNVKEAADLFSLRPGTVYAYMFKGGGIGIIPLTEGYAVLRRGK